MSGQYMLLQHHGLKGAEVVSLSSAIAVNYCLTHLDLCDNRCVVVPVNYKFANNFGAHAPHVLCGDFLVRSNDRFRICTLQCDGRGR